LPILRQAWISENDQGSGDSRGGRNDDGYDIDNDDEHAGDNHLRRNNTMGGGQKVKTSPSPEFSPQQLALRHDVSRKTRRDNAPLKPSLYAIHFRMSLNLRLSSVTLLSNPTGKLR
jgi:hypothetical protein